MINIIPDGYFIIKYETRSIQCDWRRRISLKEASDKVRDHLGHDGELIFQIAGETLWYNGLLTASKNMTYIARDAIQKLEEKETYISPFSGKTV